MRSSGISCTVLVAAEAFGGRLNAAKAAGAIARGLGEGDARRREGGAGHETNPGSSLKIDLCPIETAPAELPSDFDTRMRTARAVVIGVPRLDHETLLQRDAACEIATRARQAGVPCYAVAAENGLDLFEARILDLQVVLEASTERQLTGAAAKLAALV